ncbi:insulinase family protein [Fulvivirga maritima]|uniref:M16 family metallopeptidase n=1 Tax=Fulvivirga maritima TaxID=2904247 RepID=UPI001F1D33BE|nr:pitrilysin family protein [Fulvivirga maritima]UII28103.1 insulinase family protein [Fulvivirga maritima]
MLNQKSNLVLSGICGFLLLFAGVVSAQVKNVQEGIKYVTTVEGISEYQLSNGLKVLLFPDQSKPTITVNITYEVGSKHENYGETGMAHLLEHLVFKGSPRHEDIPQELTEHGARPNGTTWYDRTNYFETFSATDENLEWALDLESDRMVNSYISKEDLTSEMTVVRNEFEMGENSPIGVLMERVASSAYLWHNYGNTTIGARADIENVPIDRLQAFYHKYYQPDNSVLTIAGKIDPEKTLKLVDKYFSPIPKPERVLQDAYTKEPTQDGERMVTLRRVGDIQAVMAAYHIPAASHEDFQSIDIIAEIMADEPSGRLYKNLVDKKKATDVYGFAFPLKEPGLLYFFSTVRKEQPLDDASSVFLSTLDNVDVEPITDQEVERAKTKLLKDIELAYNSSDRIGLTLSEYIASGDWRLFFINRDRLKEVTTEKVQAVANKYIKSSNRTVGYFIPTENPERAKIPETPDVAALVKDYKGNVEIAAGEAFDASPSNIEKRLEREDAKKGLSVVLLPKKNRGEAVNAKITLRYGSLNKLKNKAMTAEFTADMLNKGTSTMSRQEISDKFDQLKAQLSIYGSYSQTSVYIETVKENLPAVLDLVGEILKDPSFPQEEFDKLKEEKLASAEEQLSEPMSLASLAFDRNLNSYSPDDPRYTPTFEEQIKLAKETKLEDVKKFYKDFFGATYAEVSIVGDFEKEPIKKKVYDIFGSWKSPSEFERIASKYVKTKPMNKSIETPDKANAMFMAGMQLPLSDGSSDYAAMVLGNYMLGGGFLNSRLATRIRQKEGLSYGVGSFFSAASKDDYAMFGAYAIYAPENAEALEKAFKEEINKVVTEGFTKEEVAAAKSGYLQSRQVTRSQDRSLASMLNEYLYLDRTMEWDKDFEKKIESLTVEQINAAMKKYIDADDMIYIKAGDFDKKDIEQEN